MKWLLDVLRGMVIGLANVIPGVSGGTMMVSMGIYDKLIYSINNLFKKFKECFKILLPYLIGMAAAIILGSVALKVAFEKYPLPTNTLFIGLILGSLPIILKQIKGAKINAVHVLIFLVFAALVIIPKVIANNTLVGDNVNGGSQALTLDVGHIIIYLLPFAIGIVVGIFGVAKLIEFLLTKWKVPTYCGILGMVVASPVVILMDSSIYAGFNWVIGAVSVVALIIGIIVALKLGADPEPVKE